MQLIVQQVASVQTDVNYHLRTGINYRLRTGVNYDLHNVSKPMVTIDGTNRSVHLRTSVHWTWRGCPHNTVLHPHRLHSLRLAH